MALEKKNESMGDSSLVKNLDQKTPQKTKTKRSLVMVMYNFTWGEEGLARPFASDSYACSSKVDEFTIYNEF